MAAAVTLDLCPLLETIDSREKLGPPLGYRSFLVDYSGACGAPVLAVVRDELPVVTPPAAPVRDAFEDTLRGETTKAAPTASR